MAFNWNMAQGHNSMSHQWSPKSIGIAIVAYAVVSNMFNGVGGLNKSFQSTATSLEQPVPAQISQKPATQAVTKIQPAFPAVVHALPASDKLATEKIVQQKIADLRRKFALERSKSGRIEITGDAAAGPQSASEPLEKPERKSKASGSSHSPSYYLIVVLFIIWRLRRFLSGLVSKTSEAVETINAAAKSIPMPAPVLKAAANREEASLPRKVLAKSHSTTVSQGGFFARAGLSKAATMTQRASVVSRR